MFCMVNCTALTNSTYKRNVAFSTKTAVGWATNICRSTDVSVKFQTHLHLVYMWMISGSISVSSVLVVANRCNKNTFTLIVLCTRLFSCTDHVSLTCSPSSVCLKAPTNSGIRHSTEVRAYPMQMPAGHVCAKIHFYDRVRVLGVAQ